MQKQYSENIKYKLTGAEYLCNSNNISYVNTSYL